MLQNRISPLLSIFFRVSSGTVGNSFAVPRYVFSTFVISCCPWDRWGGWGSGVSWGRSESRSGYFGESWGDYLIDLSIFSDFGGLDLCLCVIGYFVFLLTTAILGAFFRLYVAGALGLFGLQGVCGFASRSTRTSGLVLCLC